MDDYSIKKEEIVDGQRRALDAGAGLRRHVQLQSVGKLDGHAPDDAQRQA